MLRGSVNAGFTLNQLKLSAASEFRADGFDVTFDRVVEFSGRRIKFHVYCEDVLGTRVAAICLNEVNDVRIREIFDVVDLVRFSGEDIEVVVCFPISLLNRARVLIGITSRVFPGRLGWAGLDSLPIAGREESEDYNSIRADQPRVGRGRRLRGRRD